MSSDTTRNNTAKKSELLNKLTIDREEVMEASGISLKMVFFIAILSILTGGLLSYIIFQDQSLPESKNSPVLQQTPSSPASTDISTSSENNHDATTNNSHSESAILNASGYITPRRMATVSSQVPGLIKEVNVEEGISVTQGQILAQLDDTIPRVSLEQAIARLQSLHAQLQSAKASRAEANRQYQRIMKNKYSSNADKTLADTNSKKAMAAVNQISAEIKVADINVKLQRDRLAQFTIRAPFDGVVTMKNAQPGEIVSPGSAGGGFTRTGICTLVDMDSLEIEVDVNEAFIGRVSAAQKVVAHLDAYPDWSIPASVIAIIPTADRGKATVTVRIKIEIKDKKILPEMGVKVAFLKAEDQEPL